MAKLVRLYRLGKRHGTDDIEPSFAVMDIVGEGGVVELRFVIDCGLHPDNLPDLSFFRDGVLINAVFLTHAHTDHVAYAPALVPYLAPGARFYMTRPTADILMRGFNDGLSIAERRNSPPPFTEEQMFELERRIVIIRKPGSGDVCGVRSFAWPAGHINGACSFTFRVGSEIIHYAGDRCEGNQPGILGAPELPREWRPTVVAGSDCTYGADKDSDLRSREDEIGRGKGKIRQTLAKGGIVIAPGFAIARTGGFLHDLVTDGILDEGDLYMDGAARYYARRQGGPNGKWCEQDLPLNLRGVKDILEKAPRHAPRAKLIRRADVLERGRAVVATTGGMGNGPFVTWRRGVLEDPNALILFTGYVAPGTDGDIILKAARERETTGKPVTVTFKVEDWETGAVMNETYHLNCEVDQLRLGGHDSRQKIINWFERLNPHTAILSHGSEAALKSLDRELSPGIERVVRSDVQGMVEIPL